MLTELPVECLECKLTAKSEEDDDKDEEEEEDDQDDNDNMLEMLFESSFSAISTSLPLDSSSKLSLLYPSSMSREHSSS